MRTALLVMLALLLAGCSGKTAALETVSPETVPAQPSPAAPVASQPCNPLDQAAAAQGVLPGAVLAHVEFQGVQMGALQSHSGQVLLWMPEPNRYRARATLDLGNCQWRSTNVTSEVISVDRPLVATAALLNDVQRAEQLVPLWAFYGTVAATGVDHVGVRLPGIQVPPAAVGKNGTWLTIYQGVIDGHAGDAIVVAVDVQGQELGRQSLSLSR